MVFAFEFKFKMSLQGDLSTKIQINLTGITFL